MPVVGRVSVMVGKRNEHLQAARRRKRHFATVACTHMDEVNGVPKALSDQGHSLKPTPVKLYHSFSH